jgi:N-methylhydantoinase A
VDERVGAVLAELRGEARPVVATAAPGQPTTELLRASMRYVGQGHEVEVAVALDRPLDGAGLARAFEDTYRAQYTRTIAGLEVEALTWLLTLTTVTAVDGAGARPEAPGTTVPTSGPPVDGARRRRLSSRARSAWDSAGAAFVDHAVFQRAELVPGDELVGPALVVEAQTTTVVAAGFVAHCDVDGHLVLRRGRS